MRLAAAHPATRLTPAPWLCAVPLVLAALSGCGTASPDGVARGDLQRLSTVVDAVVLSTRPVVVDGTQSGVGSTAGGLIGGLAGHTVGGHREAMVAGVVGAVVGGVMGNVVERTITRDTALEILVQLTNGDRRVVVQALATESFATGEPVVLISSAGRVRVSKLPVLTPPQAAPAGPALPQAAVPATAAAAAPVATTNP